uniref:Uncharacterized protein n=1 Tax=Rhizophora mucronata TaxID=61149 RepID=A0A2P2KJS7_RHIMU
MNSCYFFSKNDTCNLQINK